MKGHPSQFKFFHVGKKLQTYTGCYLDLDLTDTDRHKVVFFKCSNLL